MPRMSPCVSAAACLAAALVSLGCQSSATNLGMTFVPGDSARIRADGSQPEMIVRHLGDDGVLSVLFTPIGESRSSVDVGLGPGVTSQTFDGGILVQIRNRSNATIPAEIEIRRFSGVTIESIPSGFAAEEPADEGG
ncbi:MAG: hypothetical protein ACF8PN_04410 [Phycisphaerales bacterium]